MSEKNIGKGLVHGERMIEYGHPSISLTKIASMWSALFNIEIRPAQVALAMIILKIVREDNKHKLDNLDDIDGYVELIRMLEKFENENMENITL